eukprot:s4047_g10.t3
MRLANLLPFVQRLCLLTAHEVVQWQRSRSEVSGPLPAQWQQCPKEALKSWLGRDIRLALWTFPMASMVEQSGTRWHDKERPPSEADIPCFERQATNLSASTCATKTDRPDGWVSLLGLDRVANFRDLAGPDASAPYRCKGGRLARGKVYRTGHWVTATPTDLSMIRDTLGICTYLDLRNVQDFESVDAECFDDYPPSPNGRHEASVPRDAGERRRLSCPFSKGLGARPLTQDEAEGRVDPSDKKAQCAIWFQKQMRSEAFHDLQVQLKTSMRAMLILNSEEVLTALRALVDERNFPVAFGCIAGKDRTGLLACLVLLALGVSDEDIISDYMFTNESAQHINACNQIAVAMWCEELRIRDPRKYSLLVRRTRLPPSVQNILDSDGDTPLWEDVNIVSDPDAIKRSMVHRDIIEYVMHEVLHKEFSGVDGYFKYIGFTPSEVDRLRELLVEPAAENDPRWFSLPSACMRPLQESGTSACAAQGSKSSNWILLVRLSVVTARPLTIFDRSATATESLEAGSGITRVVYFMAETQGQMIPFTWHWSSFSSPSRQTPEVVAANPRGEVFSHFVACT